jgi:hypothetical protein
MSSEQVLVALMEARLDSGRKEALLVETYARRLLELDRAPIYDYLYENADRVLVCLPKAIQKARFATQAWCAAPPEHWSDWAESLPRSYQGGELADLAPDLVEHLLRTASRLEPGAIRSVIEHLGPLEPALRAIDDSGDVETLVAAASETLGGREWWSSAEAAATQSEVHELLRALEKAIPCAAEALKDTRAADAVRGPLAGVEEVRGMLLLTHDLPDQTYGELLESLPAPGAELEPLLYAEVVVAKVTLHRRDPQTLGGASMIRTHLKDVKVLRAMGDDYWPQRRLAGVGCLDLRPTPSQLQTLSIYLGANPGEDAMEALSRWTERVDRRQRADALGRMIRPLFDPTRWAAVLSGTDYVEAPVIRTLRESMGKDRKTKVGQRRRMASIVGSLEIRTQLARNSVVDLIAHLLTKERPKSDLSVALVLAAGLGSNHPHQTKLERAFVAYAKRNSHKFRPEEYRSIVNLGVTIPDRYLSKDAQKRRKSIIEGAAKSGVKQLGKLLGL